VSEPRERDYLRRLESSALSAAELRRILEDPRARRLHTIRRAIAGHRATPRGEALAMIPTLFWRDLAWLSTESRVHPEVRRAADREILRRLPGLALAERIELAAISGRGVLTALRRETDPGLLRALLKNRFAIESDAVYVAVHSRSPEVLSKILECESWGRSRAVRSAVALNPATAPEETLEILPTLLLGDLRDLAASPRVAPAVRDAARQALRRRVEWESGLV
jgi:hypothetical protein